MATSTPPTAACKSLVLDAGPLLSLSPLRGLAETFYTVPQVIDELKDKRAREHFERLGLAAGVSIQVQSPDAASLAHVIQFAKKTGDYSVLSHADLCVLALTYALDRHEKEEAKKTPAGSAIPDVVSDPSADLSAAAEEAVNPTDEDLSNTNDDTVEDISAPEPPISDDEENGEAVLAEDDTTHRPDDFDHELEPLDVELQPITKEASSESSSPLPTDNVPNPQIQLSSTGPDKSAPIFDDPSDEEDGEGEWITPANVTLHKSRALDLLPSADAGKRRTRDRVVVGCMTADFAMQNVLLQMNLSLVGVEGKKIERVKSWVLRCHACFKLCKDSSRKFCPSCGNPTLLRASVTLSSPTATSSTPIMQVHLKKNFQYKTRGTMYSIPSPKAGTAKTGPGEGLILREDQTAWVRAKKLADGKRDREEKRLLNAASKNRAGQSGGVVGSWMDPDWVPEILSAGASGKGRSIRSRTMDGDMPVIGHGRKNPNERRRKA